MYDEKSDTPARARTTTLNEGMLMGNRAILAATKLNFDAPMCRAVV